MSATEVLSMAKAEGVTLVLVGDSLTWKADHQPPDDLMSSIKAHKLELIGELRAANDVTEMRSNMSASNQHPPMVDDTDQPQHFIQTAVTASPEWLAVRDAFYHHLMPCRACHAPAGRYCPVGAELRQRYDQMPMV